MSQTAFDAVSAAAASQTDENVETTKVVEKVDVAPVVDKEDEPELTPEQISLNERQQKALDLYDKLTDATQGPEVVKLLAKQLGLLDRAETKAEVREIQSTFKDKVKAKLGEDYPLLSEQLGDLFDEIASVTRNEVIQEFNKREQSRFEADINARVSKFYTEAKITDAEDAALSKLIEEFPPNPKMAPEEYLSRHLKTVRRDLEELAAKKGKATKIAENLSRRPASQGTDVNEERVTVRSKRPSAREAVEMALNGETTE